MAWDLAHDPEIEQVGIVGRTQETLESTRRWIGSDKVVCHVDDMSDCERAVKLIEQYDVTAVALPDRRLSYRIATFAIEARTSLVDVLEEYHRRPDPYETEGLEIPDGMSPDEYGDWLHETAIARGVTFVDGMGFAPGLSNITLGEAIRQVDTPISAIARVGGIPSRETAARYPLKYTITWAFEHVIREYMIRLKVIKGGRIVEVEATTDREQFLFDKFGKNAVLECAVTPGMPSFIHTRPELREFAEKTIRWPGHWQAIDTLKECGLLDLEPVVFSGCRVVPREFLLALVKPRLRPEEGETDICVMYNTMVGIKDGKKVKIGFSMWEAADVDSRVSSMMKTTGFPMAITVKMLLDGSIKEKGIVPPEDCIKGPLYQRFMDELRKRNIDILETIEVGE